MLEVLSVGVPGRDFERYGLVKQASNFFGYGLWTPTS